MRGREFSRFFLLLLLSGFLLLSNPADSYEYSWNFTPVDSDGDAGRYCSMAYNPLTGHPAVSYTESGSKNLRFAWYNGSYWSLNRHLCDNALYNTLSFNSSGFPSVAFYSDTPLNAVMYVKSLNSDWDNADFWNETLVKSIGIQISRPGLVFNSSDIPLIAHSGPAAELLLSYPEDESWYSDDISGDCLSYTSVAVNPVTGQPAIAYQDNAAGEKLKYTEFDGNSWKFPVIIHNSDGYGVSCSLAFNSSGYPGISYIQKVTGDLWYAWYNGFSWEKRLVDDVGSYGDVPDTKLAFNKSGCPGISYYDGRGGGEGDLKFAFCDLKNPSVWETETVYSESDSGIYNSFGFDPVYDLPSVLFYREDWGDLYFGKKGVIPVPDFTSSVSPGIVNMTVSFYDATYSQSSSKQWEWNFGDNKRYFGQSPPVHEYNVADIYQVTLNVSDVFGTSGIVKNITVCPYSDFTADNISGTAPLSVNFSCLSRGMPLVRNWSFGDGTYYNTTDFLQKNACHIYESAGNYTVYLRTERNNLSNLTISENMISVGIGASFKADCLTGPAPLTVVFNDTSSGNPDTWEWDFKDGTVSYGNNSTHTFLSPGLYDVTLNASSGIFSDTYSLTITVPGDTPGHNGAMDHSGGRGSGIVSGSITNANISTLREYNLKAGDIVSFKLSEGPFRTFSAVLKDDLPEIIFTIEKIIGEDYIFNKPASPVYEYCEIKIFGASESSVIASSLGFDVSSEWLLNNNFSEDEIILLMYDGKSRKWVGLPVGCEGRSQGFYSYTARIPGFSYFAISGDRSAGQMPENSMKLNSESKMSKVDYPESSVLKDKIKNKSTEMSQNSLASAYMVPFVALLLSVLFFRRRLHNK